MPEQDGRGLRRRAYGNNEKLERKRTGTGVECVLEAGRRGWRDRGQNYFFISKIEKRRKSFIHAALPLFCTFPKFFPKSKIDRQILPQIFSNFPK